MRPRSGVMSRPELRTPGKSHDLNRRRLDSTTCEDAAFGLADWQIRCAAERGSRLARDRAASGHRHCHSGPCKASLPTKGHSSWKDEDFGVSDWQLRGGVVAPPRKGVQSRTNIEVSHRRNFAAARQQSLPSARVAKNMKFKSEGVRSSRDLLAEKDNDPLNADFGLADWQLRLATGVCAMNGQHHRGEATSQQQRRSERQTWDDAEFGLSDCQIRLAEAAATMKENEDPQVGYNSFLKCTMPVDRLQKSISNKIAG